MTAFNFALKTAMRCGNGKPNSSSDRILGNFWRTFSRVSSVMDVLLATTAAMFRRPIRSRGPRGIEQRCVEGGCSPLAQVETPSRETPWTRNKGRDEMMRETVNEESQNRHRSLAAKPGRVMRVCHVDEKGMQPCFWRRDEPKDRFRGLTGPCLCLHNVQW